MKDARGVTIKEGDIVAHAVTLNRERFPEGFTVHICRRSERDRRRLILDGSVSWGYLSDSEPGELIVIDGNTDLRAVAVELIRYARGNGGAP